MSARSGEERGSDGTWFGDDYGRNGLFGNTPTRFDELREDVKPRGSEATGDPEQRSHPGQDDWNRPPVAMETASTGKARSYPKETLCFSSFHPHGCETVSGQMEEVDR